MRFYLKKILKVIGIVFIIIISISLIITGHQYYSANSYSPSTKMINSKNFIDGKFVNSIPTNVGAPGKFCEMVFKYLAGGQKDRKPSIQLPIVSSDKNLNGTLTGSLQFIWLGHSSVLLELEGKRFLFDPVFSERASFVKWYGPKRFHPVPLSIDAIPSLDAIIISHDHYDHLDKSAIKNLSNRKVHFYVPLGIGRLLEKWGVQESNIIEFDWWDEINVSNIKIISTPARHFSGRGLFDTNKTLWCSWVLKGKHKSVYFSGDTGIMSEFKEIGDKYGPFDVTFIKIGAYDELWPDIHINPEQAIEAHERVRGNALVPIHWATFDLGLHSWYEPAERLVNAANSSKANIIAPKIGELVDPTQYHNSYWWRELK